MRETSYFINELTDFVDKQEGYQLWILSSMGQAAVNKYSKKKKVSGILLM